VRLEAAVEILSKMYMSEYDKNVENIKQKCVENSKTRQKCREETTKLWQKPKISVRRLLLPWETNAVSTLHQCATSPKTLLK